MLKRFRKPLYITLGLVRHRIYINPQHTWLLLVFNGRGGFEWNAMGTMLHWPCL